MVCIFGPYAFALAYVRVYISGEDSIESLVIKVATWWHYRIFPHTASPVVFYHVEDLLVI